MHEKLNYIRAKGLGNEEVGEIKFDRRENPEENAKINSIHPRCIKPYSVESRLELRIIIIHYFSKLRCQDDVLCYNVDKEECIKYALVSMARKEMSQKYMLFY